jgi:hypothetical protein
LGLRAVVANPRKARAIYENERKSGRRDAADGSMEPRIPAAAG